MGSGVRLVDSAEETAKEVESLLKGRSIVRKNGKGAHSFFVTDAPERFIKVGHRFLGETVESAVRIER